MEMQKVVSITSQGQLTVPQSMLRSLGIKGPVKAIIRKKDNMLEVEPRNDFWSLGGSLNTGIKLSDLDLRNAKLEYAKSFGKQWNK